ncbi:hypothetical protein Fmac_015801 [Flemingia macrophylla]|uniref:Uncharacterized protein n=1 Tax=Flemingia macrophylla TaxID=520843 RepID=A0ABD1MFK1_9FABA
MTSSKVFFLARVMGPVSAEVMVPLDDPASKSLKTVTPCLNLHLNLWSSMASS